VTDGVTGQERSAAASRPLRVAIAGCHRMLSRTPGSHNFAADFAAVPETQVVAVFDRGADTREGFTACWRSTWGELRPYDDYARMLDEVRPDIVCLSTRQTMHAAQLEEAVEAGVKGIVCDKPLATSLEEADAMLARCREAGVPLAFALTRRWDQAYQRLCQLVAEGAVGTVTGVIAGGVPNLINHGPHWYDVALALAGDAEPRWVSGLVDDVSAEAADSNRRRDPPGRGQVGLEGGAVVYLTPAGGPSPSFEVLGTRGRILTADDARSAVIWETAPAGQPARPRALELPARDGYEVGPALVRDLVQAVRSSGTTACDAEHARRATEIGFAMHLSGAAGGARIDLPAAERSLRIPSLPWGNE
jgi:predicted dehydrogenase